LACPLSQVLVMAVVVDEALAMELTARTASNVT
jgi:hypothetical protein